MMFLDELGIETVPFAEPYISEALNAYRRYGKGVHARLSGGLSMAQAFGKQSAPNSLCI
jgi:uncharacterized protein with PIN domain